VHESLKKELFKQEVRSLHKNLIKEEATLYSTFVQPFTDVLSSVALAGQDILNSAKLLWDTFWTLSPEKLDKIHDDFTTRKGKIAEKWKPIVDRSQQALATGDAGLVLFMMNPPLYLATDSLGKAVQAGSSVSQYLSGAGLKIPLLSSVMDMSLLDDVDTSISKGASTSSKPPKEKSFLAKLAGLFYLENSWREGELILEKEEVKNLQQANPVSPEKAVDDFLRKTGVLKELEKSAEELISSSKVYVDSILLESEPKIKLMKYVLEASNLKDFSRAMKTHESENSNTDTINYSKIEDEINAGAEKLIKSEDFKEILEKDIGPEVFENMTEAEKLDYAKKIVFINQKKNLDEKMLQGIKDLKNQVISILESEEPDAKTRPLLSKNKNGIKLIKVYDDAKLSIKNL
jgi:hypothetical protein